MTRTRRTVSLLCLSTALTAMGCDQEPVDLDDPGADTSSESGAEEAPASAEELALDLDLRAEDPQPTSHNKWVYHKLLSKFVRLRAYYEGLRPMPEAPEIREELVALGQALSFDKELSGNRDISCMTCHHPALASDDDLSLSIGVGGVGLGANRTHPDGTFIPRNAPGLFNLHDLDTMFWDGRVNVHGQNFDTPADEEITPEMAAVFEFGSVSAQAMFPVTSRAEMRGALGENELAMVRDDDFTSQWAAIMNRLGQIPEYVQMFEAAYPGTAFEDMTFAHAANAIAGFEIAGFEATESPYDEWMRGEDFAMDIPSLLGVNHFVGDGNCVSCHSGSSLTDEAFHNTALPQFGPGKNDGPTLSDDWGRYNESFDVGDFYRFRTSPLRNIELTGPYGHAGQFVALEDFVRHYLDPADSLNNWDPTQIDPLLQPTQLPTQQTVLSYLDPELENPTFAEHRVDEMMAFMSALTDPNSEDLLDLVPDSVPSGLPVEDNVLVEPENREGAIDLNFFLPGSLFKEFQFYTPEMCDGGGTGQITFDREANTVAIDVEIDGLPYRPSVCYDYNPGNQFNEFPDCVDNGKWQLWVVPRMFNLQTTFYYDLADGSLLGSEYDDLTLPPTAIALPLPSLQMMCTDFFESDPNTLHASHHEEYDYDKMLDMRGTGGVIFSLLPHNLFNPTALDTYYTQDGLPESAAMNFDDFIHYNSEGKGGLAVAMSYEPFPKPDYLASRDNLMLGFAATWPIPNVTPENPFYEPPVECGTNFQWPYPGVGFDPPPSP